MKKHKKLKSLIFSFACAALCLCFLALPTNANVVSSKTFAASPVGHYKYSLSSQTTAVSISTAVSGESSQSTLYLYPHSSNSNTSISSYFGYYSEKEKSENNVSTTTELIHSYYAGKVGVVGPHSAQFATTISISKNLQIAIQKGYVSISASAYTTSGTLGKTWGFEDQADTVVMELNAYNDASSTGKSASGSYADRTSYPSTKDVVSLSASDLVSLGLAVDKLELSFKSETNGQTGEYMAVKEPIVIFTSTDTTAPTLSNPTFVNQKTALPTEFSFTATDNESGIQKVEIKNGTGEWETLASYSTHTTSANFTYSNLSGNSVLVKVTDNVGNEKVMPYVFVGVEDLYLDETFNIVSSDISNIDGSSYSVYVNKILNGSNVGRNNIVSDSTPISLSQCGDYTFEVVVADKNGNVLNSYTLNTFVDYNVYIVSTSAKNATITSSYQTKRASSQTISFSKASENTEFVKLLQNGEVVDPSKLVLDGDVYSYTFDVSSNQTFEAIFREKVDIVIGSTYDYNANGFVPAVIVTATDRQQVVSDAVLSYTYYNADKSASIDSILNAGTYVIDAVINSESYYGSVSASITINPKEIEITQKSLGNFEFDGNAHYFDFDAEVLKEGILVSYKLNGANVQNPTNAGIYVVELALAKPNQNYTLSFESTFEIQKRKVTVSANSYNITYGDAVPTFEYILSNDFDGSGLEFSLVCENFSINAGSYDIMVENKDSVYSNFEISYVNGKITIAKKAITVEAINLTKVYGNNMGDNTVDYNPDAGLLFGDTLSGNLVRAAGEDVGYYNVSIGTLSNPNYAITLAPATFSITKRVAFVRIKNATTTYGETSSALEFVETYEKSNIIDSDLQLFRDSLFVDEITGVGSYTISADTSMLSNYAVVVIEAELEVLPATISVEIQDATKVYGSVDPEIAYEINGLVGSDALALEFTREAGENVGSYTITLVPTTLKNYVISNADVSATLSITKANFVLDTLQDKSVVYTGENQTIDALEGVELTYKYFDANGNETTDVSNVGEYTVVGYFAGNENYNSAETNTAILSITKANLVLDALQDKSVIYTGEAHYIDEITSDFEIVYEYTLLGSVVENPTNAGKYSVVAKFAGNENYNSAKTNTATLEIKQKLIPITMKKVMFNYNGKQQLPEFEINLVEEVEVTINYTNGVYPIEVGEYPFEIRSNNVNYICNFVGTLKIVPEFYSISDSGNASVGITNVGFSGSNIEIYEEINSNLSSKFNVLRDERKCISVYAFKNIDIAKGSTDVFTVKIKAKDTNRNVLIYSVDGSGKMTEVSYAEIDGYYVLSVNDLSSKIIVTEADKTLSYLKIFVLVLTFVLSVTITKAVKRSRANKFFRKNTVMSFTNQEELLANAQIVSSKIYKSGLSSKDILK